MALANGRADYPNGPLVAVGRNCRAAGLSARGAVGSH